MSRRNALALLLIVLLIAVGGVGVLMVSDTSVVQVAVQSGKGDVGPESRPTGDAAPSVPTRWEPAVGESTIDSGHAPPDHSTAPPSVCVVSVVVALRDGSPVAFCPLSWQAYNLVEALQRLGSIVRTGVENGLNSTATTNASGVVELQVPTGNLIAIGSNEPGLIPDGPDLRGRLSPLKAETKLWLIDTDGHTKMEVKLWASHIRTLAAVVEYEDGAPFVGEVSYSVATASRGEGPDRSVTAPRTIRLTDVSTFDVDDMPKGGRAVLRFSSQRRGFSFQHVHVMIEDEPDTHRVVIPREVGAKGGLLFDMSDASGDSVTGIELFGGTGSLTWWGGREGPGDVATPPFNAGSRVRAYLTRKLADGRTLSARFDWIEIRGGEWVRLVPEFHEPSQITFRVVSPTGAPIAKAIVQQEREAYATVLQLRSGWSRSVKSGATGSDKDGTVRWTGLVPGHHTLYAEAAGYLRRPVAFHVPSAGSSQDLGDFVLEPMTENNSGSLVVTLVDAPSDGQYRVGLVQDGGSLLVDWIPIRADGTAEFKLLQLRPCRVVVLDAAGRVVGQLQVALDDTVRRASVAIAHEVQEYQPGSSRGAPK